MANSAPSRPCVPRPGARSAVLAALIATATDVLYLVVIRSQGPLETEWGRVAFVAGGIAAAALAFAFGAITPLAELRPIVLGTAALVCWALGIVGIFSIGLPLLLAAVVGTVALLHALCADARREVSRRTWLAWLGTLALLGVGLVVTQPTSDTVHVGCPAKGHWQGSTMSNGVTTAYRCDDGHLTLGPER